MTRVMIDYMPFGRRELLTPQKDLGWDWITRGDWPAFWIDHPDRPLGTESVAVFRLDFDCPQPATVRIHVSADNRYRLFVDGQPIGRGPERGDERNWCYESYDLPLAAGSHQFAALTWWLGDKAPFAQRSVRPGFVLAAEGEWLDKLSTGKANWQARLIDGIELLSPRFAWGTGWKVRVDGRKFPWDWMNSRNDWQGATKIVQACVAQYKNEVPPYWRLRPAQLPPMRSEMQRVGVARYVVDSAQAYPVDSSRNLGKDSDAFTALLAQQKPLTIPPRTTRLAIIDLRDYFCAFPVLKTSGGRDARVRIHWAEALYVGLEGQEKGNRNEIEGKFFRGIGDEFVSDGGASRVFSTLWWEAGRYLEVLIETAEEPLTLEELLLEATGYPLGMQGEFHASDERLEKVIPLALRTLQSCSHETYMDCPYYEQLMYVGDARLEVLATYAFSADDLLPRKTIDLFDESRVNGGLTQSRYPSRVAQVIPPFSLWWVGMVYDHLLWRGDLAFTRRHLNGVRAVCEAYRSYLRADGLMDPPPTWNYMDWVMEPVLWQAGVPPTGDYQPNSVLMLHLALALRYKSQIELACGEELLAKRDVTLAKQLVEKVMAIFYRPDRGLLSDDLQGRHFSEHAQCLAILTGLLNPSRQKALAKAMLAAQGLSQTTIYFTHYLFETFYQLGLAEPLLQRLALWFELEKNGFKTTFEHPEPSRSDCHAWAAHPVFHYYASILGIRPAKPGLAEVCIAPLLPKSLQSVSGTLRHPRGAIRLALERRPAQGIMAEIELPDGAGGQFVWRGNKRQLIAGFTRIEM